MQNIKFEDGVLIDENGVILEQDDNAGFVVVEYNALEATVSALENEFSGDIPDANTKEGYAQLKEGVKYMASVKKAVEDTRVFIKAPALARSKAVDSEAKIIKARIEKYHDTWKAAKKAKDDEAKLREEARIEAITARIAAMREKPIAYMQSAPDLIKIAVESLEAEKCNKEDFHEFTMEALEVRSKSIEQLKAILTDREAAEKLAEQRLEEQRVAGIKGRIQHIKDAAMVGRKDTSEVIRNRILNLKDVNTSDGFGEFQDEAELARRDTMESLSAELVEIIQDEAESAELERLKEKEVAETVEEPETVGNCVKLTNKEMFIVNIVNFVHEKMEGGETNATTLRIETLRLFRNEAI